MKLSPAQVQRVRTQLRAQVVPDRHAVTPDLQRAFGDHTFFLDSTGLTIVEATPADSAVGNVVKLARWVDAEHTQLKIEPAEATPVQVELRPTDSEVESKG